jgi:1,4-alpha-glucan branching enzyme
MKKLLLSLMAFIGIYECQSQILTSDPPFPTQADQITVYYNVASGNAEIPVSTIPIYAHTGVITNLSSSDTDWQHVQGNWGTADPNVVMTPMGGGLHKIVITPNTFYGLTGGETASKMVFVFRNQSGSVVGRNADGSDIYLDLYPVGYNAAIIAPFQESQVVQAGQDVIINAAASALSNISISVNSIEVASVSGDDALSYTFNETAPGQYLVEMTASDGTDNITDSIIILVMPPVNVAASPAGTIDGINIVSNSSVRLQIFAPNKDYIFVLGDFNNWQFDLDYLMNRTPDGSTYWLDITGLDASTEYRFQYSIDAEDMRVAEIYSDKILDFWNDPYIPETTYPNLIDYPVGLTSQAVSVFKTNEPAFNWTDQSYSRPPMERLVVYELLVRDFSEERTYQAIIDSLDYLENLGITAIELMPINEFEGNDSWGYNPAFYFAPDKAYGTKEKLKEFINECHLRGIAVIQDIALNHSFGQNPMVRMYFDANSNACNDPYGAPTAENPWFNQCPTHPFNVGYDFNHENTRTRNFCKRVLDYWLEEFHIDGYRFDLSKGFTQNNTFGNVGAWGQYDQSRVNILNDYYTHMQATEPGAYLILEHLADNSEETVLSGDGMMLWGKMTTEYEQSSMGYNDNCNLNNGSYQNRGWADAHLVTYAESHDEERVMYKTLNFGNSSGNYNTTNLNTALDRQELVFTFLIPVPGPKMIWQFEELGYDYSINYCPDGTINSNCRVSAKPVRWDYADVANRYQVYKVASALNNLKKTLPLFSTNDFDVDMGGLGKRIHLNSAGLNATIVGNFNVTAITMIPGFQHTGTWYNYFTGESLNVTDQGAAMDFQPGQYMIYFDQPQATPDTSVNVTEIMKFYGLDFMAYPNPVKDILNIGFNNSESGRVVVDLLDITGNLITTLKDENMGAGNKSLSVSTANLSNGTYFIRITSSGEKKCKPIVLFND